MNSVLRELLEPAPTTKLLFSSDAHRSPELFHFGAKWGREALAQVLREAVRDGALDAGEADIAARCILHDNARELYDRMPFYARGSMNAQRKIVGFKPGDTFVNHSLVFNRQIEKPRDAQKMTDRIQFFPELPGRFGLQARLEKIT